MMSGWSSREYEYTVKNLNSPQDVRKISQKTGIDIETLCIIFLQKETRRMIRLHSEIFKKRDKLLQEWKSGRSIVEIAKEERFSPVLLVHILLPAMAVSKKKTKRIVKNPKIANDKRLEREIREAMEVDYLYSPKAHEDQRKRGIEGERRLFSWLDSKGVEYIKEEEMKKGKGLKTPDALLREPMNVLGRSVVWLDSKSLFGDPEEIKRDYEKQFKYYVKNFGPGAVIYWYGYVEIEDVPDDVLILDPAIIKSL